MLPPPAPLSPLSPFATASFTNSSTPSAGTSTSSPAFKPNTQKDLPTSPRLGARSGFWGGAGGANMFGGGITPVHTTLIPEVRMAENMNPSLNVAIGGPSKAQMEGARQAAVQSQILAQLQNLGGMGMGDAGGMGGFDAFTDVHPFTLKSLDAYRMQLWGRVAMQTQQAQRLRAAQPPPQVHPYSTPTASPGSSPSGSPSPMGSPSMGHANLSGLATGLRPLHFTSQNTPTSPSSGAAKLPTSHVPAGFGGLFSGKAASSSSYHGSYGFGYPTPPASPKGPGSSSSSYTSSFANNVEKEKQQMQTQQNAMLASLVSQSLLRKMGSAFWDAFSGSSASSTPSAPKMWDADKVRRVLDGTAVLKVVDVEPATPVAKAAAAPAMLGADLEESMRSLSLGSRSVADSSASLSDKASKKAWCMDCKSLRGRRHGSSSGSSSDESK